MHNAIVFSKDLSLKSTCSLQMAHRMLGEGQARIIKFYPFTVQLKNFPFKDTDLDFNPVSVNPNNNPPVLMQKRKLEVVEV